MDDIQINGTDGEEVIGDDFYEKIEAPKFVDLAAPDRCRTENDDRYWFCLRVGCDQKHEDEMDSEAIYKNFVLRVMAARSPSVRLRKALYKRDSSSNVECPRTVPAKSSKSRVSRLAMISSISQKMGEANVKVRHVPKQSSTTPNMKAAKQTYTKAVTAPRNSKGLSNQGTFASVRNPKPTTIEVPKNKVVAKALVFHSPKKAVKLKKSVELSSSLRKMCAVMKKLEITDANKKNALGCNKPLAASSRKQLRGREVKSRVFDSLHSRNQKAQEAKSLKCLKKKNSEKDLPLSIGPICHKQNEKDSTEMDFEAKSKDFSLKVKISSPSRSKMTSISNSEGMNSEDDGVPKSQKGGNNENKERSSHKENIQLCSNDKEIPEATESDDKENALASQIRVSESKAMEIDNKENASASDDKENALASQIRVSESKAMEIDNKENASASDENRKLNCATDKVVKKNVLERPDTYKYTQKVSKVISKTLKENSTTVQGAQVMKYRKPKITNPKPFRLRTDERGILKEANLEKKHHQAPLKETTTTTGSQGGNPGRKYQNVQINGNCLGQIENIDCDHEGSNNESDTRTLQDQPISSSGISKGSMERKLSTTPLKRTVPIHQKTKFPPVLEKLKDKAAQKSEGRLEQTKSPPIKQLVRPRGVASSRKKLVSLMKPGQLLVIKETSDPNKSGTSLATKASSASNASRPLPQGRRRHTTIPKEPNFHSLHAPKSCIKLVV